MDKNNHVLAMWEKMSIPSQCLGFALSPRFRDSRYLASLVPEGTTRRALDEDKEVIMGVYESI